MELHGAALERMLGCLQDAGAAGEKLLDRWPPIPWCRACSCSTDSIRSTSKRGYAAPSRRPGRARLRSRCGVERCDGGVVRIRLHGVESGFAARTVRSAVEDAIYQAAPDGPSLVMWGWRTSPRPISFRWRRSAVDHREGRLRSMPTERTEPARKCFRIPQRFAGAPAGGTLRVVRSRCGSRPRPPARAGQTATRLRVQCLRHPFQRTGRPAIQTRPAHIRFLADFRLTDAQWESLMIPINMAFFFKTAREQGWLRSIRARPAPPNRCCRWSPGRRSSLRIPVLQ